MKKHTLLTLCFFLSVIITRSQDIGYRTVDAGGEFQWYSEGVILNFQLAFNSKIHHSFLVRLGYNNSRPQQTETHNSEDGSGWGGGIGYRYYPRLIPFMFFIGAGAN